MKRKFQYIQNSEMIYLDEPLFFYSWNYNEGHAWFGGFYTETEFDTYRKQKESNHIFFKFNNITRRRISEGYLWELIEEQKSWKTFFMKKERN